MADDNALVLLSDMTHDWHALAVEPERPACEQAHGHEAVEQLEAARPPPSAPQGQLAGTVKRNCAGASFGLAWCLSVVILRLIDPRGIPFGVSCSTLWIR